MRQAAGVWTALVLLLTQLADVAQGASPLKKFTLRGAPADDGATLLLVLTAVALGLAVAAQLADVATTRVLEVRGVAVILVVRCAFVGVCIGALVPGCRLVTRYLRGDGVRAAAGAAVDEYVWAIVVRALGRASAGRFQVGAHRVGLGKDVVGPWWDSRVAEGGVWVWYMVMVLLVVVSVGGAVVSVVPERVAVRRGVFFTMVVQAVVWMAVAVPVAYSGKLIKTGTPLRHYWLNDRAYSKHWQPFNAPAELTVDRFLENWYVPINQKGRRAVVSLAGVRGMREHICKEFEVLQPGATPLPIVLSEDEQKEADDAEAAAASAAAAAAVQKAGPQVNAAVGGGGGGKPGGPGSIATGNVTATRLLVRQAEGGKDVDPAAAAAAAAAQTAAASVSGPKDKAAGEGENVGKKASSAGKKAGAKGKGDGDRSKGKEKGKEDDGDEDEGDAKKAKEETKDKTSEKEKDSATPTESTPEQVEKAAEAKRRDLTIVKFVEEEYLVEDFNNSLPASRYQQGNLTSLTSDMLGKILVTYLIGKPLRGDHYTGLGYLALPAMVLAPALVGQAFHKWYFWPLSLPWIAVVVAVGLFGTPAALREAVAPREATQLLEFCGDVYKIRVTTDSGSLRHFRTDQAIIGLTVLVLLVRAFSWLTLDDVQDAVDRDTEFGGDKNESWYESEKSARLSSEHAGNFLRRLDTNNTAGNDSFATDGLGTDDLGTNESDEEAAVVPAGRRKSSSLRW